MKNVAEGKNYRIFYGKVLGILPYYILEDSSNIKRKDGVDFGVKLTTHYFKTLNQIKNIMETKCAGDLQENTKK